MKLKIVLLLVFLCIMTAYAFNAYAEPPNTYVYVGSHDSNMVSVLDPVSNQKITDIKVDAPPYYVLLNPAGTILAVTFSYAVYPHINFYSTIDQSLIKSVYCEGITGITFDDTGSRLYVSQNSTLNKISIIDMSTYTVVKSVNIDTWAPGRILYYNNSVYLVSRLWMAPTYANILKFNEDLDLGTYVGGPGLTIRQQFYSYSLMVDKTNNRIIVSGDNATLWGFNAYNLALEKTYVTGRPATLSVFGADVNNSGYVYAAVYATPGTICVFNPDGTILTNLSSPSADYAGITDLTLNRYNRTMYVSEYYLNRLSVINTDTGSLIANGYVGNTPFHISMGTQVISFQHLTKFITQSTLGIFKYSDVRITVYDQYDTLLFTKYTDDNGEASFYLQPNVNYRFWFCSESDNIDTNRTYMPVEDTYYVDVKGLFQDWNPLGWLQGVMEGWTGTGSGNVDKDVTANWTVNTSVSPRLWTVNYGDKTASTSEINYTIMRYWMNNGTYTIYNTTIIAGSNMDYGNITFSLPAAIADGQSWRLVVTSTTDAYGTVTRNDDYHFPGASYPLPGLPTSWYPYVAFALIFVFSLMFTYVSTGVGLIVMAGLSLIFVGMGWIPFSSTYVLVMQVLAVFGAGYIFKMRKRQEGI